MRLVLDTNVLVSAFFWNGNERRILLACITGEHRIVTSSALLDEARRVLGAKFGVPEVTIDAFLSGVSAAADVVTPREQLAVIPEDPADDRVLECAVEGEAEAIVTGDRHLLRLGVFRTIRIVRASSLRA